VERNEARGYVPNYRGNDPEAAREFDQLGILARQLETTWVEAYCLFTPGLLPGVAVVKLPLALIGSSEDVEFDAVQDRVTFRYPGFYSLHFTLAGEYNFAFAGSQLSYDFHVNGGAFSRPGFTRPPGTAGWVEGNMNRIQFLNAKDYIEVFLSSSFAADTFAVHPASYLTIRGTRL
jgi:hypothetical protein